jgi:quercetin dioxygenase-like cupin family protein
MIGGWFIGDFVPSSFKTKNFEVCYKKHQKGENWPTHYHKISTEINLLVRGKMKIQGKILTEGDIFILNPFEIANPEFLEDCEVVIIKTPSSPGDKFEIE